MWWHVVLTILFMLVLILPFLGIGLGIIMLVCRGMTFLLMLVPHGMLRVWHWLRPRGSDAFGSAHFASRQEIDAAELHTPGGIVLGVDAQGNLLADGSHHHVLCLAPSGARKSRSLFLPTLRSWPASVLVLDPKGELVADIAHAREAYGPVWCFDGTPHGAHLNPLDGIGWEASSVVADVQRAAASILAPPTFEREPHWRQGGEQFLGGLLMDRAAHGEASLGAVYRWLTAPTQSLTDKLHDLLKSPIPMVASAARSLLDKSPNERSAIVSTVTTALRLFDDPGVVEATHRSDFRWWALQDEVTPTTLFLSIRISDLVRMAPLTRLITELLIARITARGVETPRHRLLLALDETATLGHAALLEQSLSYLRGYGCRVLLCFQDAPQMTRTYGQEHSLFSPGVWWVSAPHDLATATIIEHKLGPTTAVRPTRTTSYNLWGLLQRTTYSEQENARPLMTTDELSRIEPMRAIVWKEGHAPIMLQKYVESSPPVETVVTQTPVAALPAPQQRIPLPDPYKWALINSLLIAASLLTYFIGGWGHPPSPPTSPPATPPAAVHQAPAAPAIPAPPLPAPWPPPSRPYQVYRIDFRTAPWTKTPLPEAAGRRFATFMQCSQWLQQAPEVANLVRHQAPLVCEPEASSR